MFSEYFASQSKHLVASIEKSLKEGDQKKGKGKNLKAFNEFYKFLKDHLPENLTLATGKVRNKKHILNKNTDVLLYERVIPKAIDLAGGYVYTDLLRAFITLDEKLDDRVIENHVGLTNALKTLYRMDKVIADNEIIHMYSMHVIANGSGIGELEAYRDKIEGLSRDKGIPVNSRPDLVVILNEALMLRNWEDGGRYIILETKEDSLMWFYVLMMEYLDQDQKLPIDLRDMIKTNKRYNEY